MGFCNIPLVFNFHLPYKGLCFCFCFSFLFPLEAVAAFSKCDDFATAVKAKQGSDETASAFFVKAGKA